MRKRFTNDAYRLGPPDGGMQVERRGEGLFARADWLRLLTRAGSHSLGVVFNHSELDPDCCELFVATNPMARPPAS